MLLEAKFQELTLAETWNLKKEGKYFFIKNLKTLIAFTVGP